MVDTLNSVKNQKIIKIIDNYEVCFLEEALDIQSPVSDYYFKTIDLSINLKLKLKWGLYGFYFMKSISDNVGTVENDYEENMFFCESINSNLKYPKEKHELILDDVIIDTIGDFTREIDSEYIKSYYSENSIIHFKLKINIGEFIILQNTSFPRLCLLERYPNK